MKRILTPVNEKFIDERGILNIIIQEGAEITLENLREDHEMGLGLTGGKKMRALVDARANFTSTEEAREFMRSDIMNKTRIATAVVTTNLASRIIVNFCLRFHKPATPLKMFSDFDKAVKWLLSMKEH
ncbi:MAG TPA: hypothetical protein VFU15_07375 [Bacteroidia bacterium]|nr:hypothetical protein [Bacteroidia bacterium]